MLKEKKPGKKTKNKGNKQKKKNRKRNQAQVSGALLSQSNLLASLTRS